jgi:hypothetical protein
MARLIIGLASALALAACTTTSETRQVAGEPAQDTATLQALAPAAGSPADTDVTAAAAPEGAASVAGQVASVDPAASIPADTSAVDQAAQTYLNCVVSRAAQSAETGRPAVDAVEIGIDACRNHFRAARWAYRDAGASEAAADRYGVNLLAFVRNEALSFLEGATAQQ